MTAMDTAGEPKHRFESIDELVQYLPDEQAARQARGEPAERLSRTANVRLSRKVGTNACIQNSISK